MAIYTRNGDQGMTGLRKGFRLSKSSLQISVLGGLDEINCNLGVVLAILDSWLMIFEQQGEDSKIHEFNSIKRLLNGLQSDLFCVGSEIANFKPEINEFSSNKENESSVIVSSDIVNIKKLNGRWFGRTAELESEIDKLDSKLPELKNFILPGGCLIGANLHLTRAVVRRVERELVKFLQPTKFKISDNLISEHGQGWLAYLNRLGDLMFVCARYINNQLEVKEQIWQM